MTALSKRIPLRTKTLDYDRDKDLIYLYNFPLQVERAIQEVQGVAGMIIYDGEVSDQEIAFLNEWLKQHEGLTTKYPLKELKAIFAKITEDDVVTPEERNRLFEFLQSIAIGSRTNPIVDGIFTDKPKITFKGKIFVLTGEMEFGPREKAEQEIRKRGGVVSNSCTLKTNYLVVGNLGSEAYKYGRFGTKIEKALSIKEQRKSAIQIVRERDFVRAVVP